MILNRSSNTRFIGVWWWITRTRSSLVKFQIRSYTQTYQHSYITLMSFFNPAPEDITYVHICMRILTIIQIRKFRTYQFSFRPVALLCHRSGLYIFLFFFCFCSKVLDLGCPSRSGFVSDLVRIRFPLDLSRFYFRSYQI